VDFASIPSNYDKFLDIAIKQIEFVTTTATLMLGAVAYLATKRLLEIPKADRPPILWIIIPSLLASASLVIAQLSYVKIENALLMARPEDFGVWWQEGRIAILAFLILSAVSLGISFSVFSRR
jgi:hypothetical protein